MSPDFKKKFIISLDRWFGDFFVKILPKPRARELTSISRVLFVRPGGIGDAILLIPAINSLRKYFPDINIDILAEKRNAVAFSLCSGVDAVHCYDSKGLISALCSEYDVIIDTEQWYKLTSVVTRLTRSKVKVGYNTNVRSRLYTHAIEYSHDHYEARSFLNLLQPISEIAISDESVVTDSLVISDHDVERGEKLLGVFATRNYVVFSPGSSLPEKHWGVDKYRELAQKINSLGLPVVVVGGGKDRESGDAILSTLDGLNVAGMTSLAVTASVVKGSALLVSSDSAVLHIGAALDKPTVSIFGPSNEGKWAPRGEHHIVVSHHLPCSPCSRFGFIPNCSTGWECIKKVTVDEVFQAVKSLLIKDSCMEDVT